MGTVKYNFTSDSDAAFETSSHFIYDRMNGNPYFPKPAPSMDVLKVAVDNYSTALVKALDRSRFAISEKRAYRTQLEKMLVQLAMYVMQESNGNQVMADSSGFPMPKKRTPRIIANPGAVKLVNGISSGELKASVPGVAGASSYIHFITTDPPTDGANWQSTTSTRRTITFTNLKPGVRYYVRTSAVGSDGQITTSPVSSIYVQ